MKIGEEKYKVIKEEVEKLGFLDVGITGAGFSIASAKRLLKRKKAGNSPPFVREDIIKRITPKKITRWAKSCIIVTYPTAYSPFSITKPGDGYLRGRISSAAWGRDYHEVITEKLKILGEKLLQKGIISKYYSFVDKTPLCERELAFRCKIGKFGKNNSLISYKGGSYVFLGGLIIDEDLTPGLINSDINETGEVKECKNCNRCIDICPGSALGEGYTLNYDKCVSYLTVKKGYIPEKSRALLGDYIYGCDRCLEVCPVNYVENNMIKAGNMIDLEEEIEHIFPRLDFILNLSKKEFKDHFGNRAIYWRGKTIIQRNAAVVVGNLKDPDGVDLLLKVLDDKGEIVVAHALWSLGQIFDELTPKKKHMVRRKLEDLKKRKDIWSEEFRVEYSKLLELID